MSRILILVPILLTLFLSIDQARSDDPAPPAGGAGKRDDLVAFRFADKSAHRTGFPKTVRSDPPAGHERTHGGKSMLVIRVVKFGDSPETIKRIRGSGDVVRNMYEQLDRYWLTSSFGKLWVECVTLAPLVTLSEADSGEAKRATVSARVEAAKAMRLRNHRALRRQYDFITVIFDASHGFGGGNAAVEGPLAKLGRYRSSTLVHELSHNLGQGIHCMAWVPTQGDDLIAGGGTFVKNGHPFAALGGFNIDNKNVLSEPLQMKHKFGWVTLGEKDEDIRIVRQSTRVRLHQFDHATPRGTLGALIARPGSQLGATAKLDPETRASADRFTHYLLSFVASTRAATEQGHPIGRKLVGSLAEHVGRGLVVERVSYNPHAKSTGTARERRQRATLAGTCIIDCTAEATAATVRSMKRRGHEFLSNCFLPVGATLVDRGAGISITSKAVGTDKDGKYIDVEIRLSESKER